MQDRALGSALSRLVAARGIAETWRIFCVEMERYGLDMILYGSSRLTASQSIGGDGTLVLMHAPDDFAEVYLDRKYYMRSLTFQWGVHNNRFVVWEDALAEAGVHPSPNLIGLKELNAHYGVETGFMGGLSDVVPGTRGALSFSSSKGMRKSDAARIWSTVGDDVMALCRTMHLRMASLPQDNLFPPLTSRQLEVLFWYAEGKMVQDISTIMGISCGTVEKHLRMAREALEADTTAHAVRKATSLNLLTA